MKQVSILFISWFLAAFSYKAMAQTEGKDKKKQSEEIIIRKLGDKDIKMTIQIDGDNITIDGKPLSEYKNEDITVNKRNIIVRDGNQMIFEGRGISPEAFGWGMAGNSKVMLGVTTEKTDGGVKVEDVTKDSPAEKAGVKEGDIISKLNDATISTPQELFDAVNKYKAGDEVTISLKRDGKPTTLKAKLEERKTRSFSMTTPDGMYRSFTIPPVPPVPPMPGAPELPEMQRLYELKGLENLKALEELKHLDFSNMRQQKLGLKIQDTEDGKGVKVISVDEKSAAETAGIKEGDIITQIGGEKVDNTDDARQSIHQNRDKTNYTIKARRNKKEMSFDIKIPKKLKTTSL